MSNYRKRRSYPGNSSPPRKKRNTGKKFLKGIAITLAAIACISLAVSLFPRGSDMSIGVNPTEPTVSPEPIGLSYEQLMADYVCVASDDFSTPDVTLAGISSVALSNCSIFTEKDAEGNTYLKFGNFTYGTVGAYVNLAHRLGDQRKIVFEVDFRYNDPGLYLYFFSRGENSKLMSVQNGTMRFYSADCTPNLRFDPDTWYKLTYVLDLENGLYDIYVNQEQIVAGAAVPSNLSELTSLRIQCYSLSNEGGYDGDFLIDNLKWYIPSDYVVEVVTEPSESEETT